MVAMPAKRGTSSPPNGWLKGGRPGAAGVFVMAGIAGDAAIVGKAAADEDRKTQHARLDFVRAGAQRHRDRLSGRQRRLDVMGKEFRSLIDVTIVAGGCQGGFGVQGNRARNRS